MITSNKQSRKDITWSHDCCESKKTSVTRKFQSRNQEIDFNGKKKEVLEHLALSLPLKVARKQETSICQYWPRQS